MLVRKRGTSVYQHPSGLVMGVFEVKGPWELKLDGGMSLQAAWKMRSWGHLWPRSSNR